MNLAARLTHDLTADLSSAGLEGFYRDLHRHPELSMREHRTSAKLAAEQLVAGIRRIVAGECSAAGCVKPPEITVGNEFPVTVNDAALDEKVAAVHAELFGTGAVIDFGPAMGSEDFSRLAPDGVPYDFWQVPASPDATWAAAPGADLEEKFGNVPGNHSPLFAPDPAVIAPGVQAMVAAALTGLAFEG